MQVAKQSRLALRDMHTNYIVSGGRIEELSLDEILKVLRNESLSRESREKISRRIIKFKLIDPLDKDTVEV